MGKRVSVVSGALRILAAAALTLAVFATPAAAAGPDKDAAIVIDATSGRVLYARSADARRFPASLTKVMTLYLLFEAIDQGKIGFGTRMKVSSSAAAQPPSKLGLKPGETITVRDAIAALVVRSANDVAVVVAEALAGSESNFANRMTRKARALGMNRTTFRNASGLPDSGQITTATDMGRLGQAIAQDFPHHYHFFARDSFTWRGRAYRTHNRVLGEFDGADGIKTGYTRASGFNLITSAVRDEVHLIGVVLGGKSGAERDADMRMMMETAYQRVIRQPSLVVKRNRFSGERHFAGARPQPNPLRMPGAGPSAEETVMALASRAQAAPLADPAVPARPARDAIAAVIAQAEAPVILPAPKPAVEQGDGGSEAAPIRFASAAAAGTAARAPATAAVQAPALAPAGPVFAIQIGAFGDEASAAAQLAGIAARAPDLLADARRLVQGFDAAGTTLYRARFGPFDENRARETCRQMTDRGITCFAVSQPLWQ